MKQLSCPTCRTTSLSSGFLEKLLPTMVCPSCHGHWLLIEDFVMWKADYGHLLSDVTAEQPELSPQKKLLICPMTGKLMQKFPIHELSDHTLNFSIEVSGVWLKADDWQLLKSLDLALDLNKIFTPAWQNNVKQNQTKQRFEARYIERFGQNDYEQLKAFRLWLDEHDEKDAMISFLTSKNPWAN